MNFIKNTWSLSDIDEFDKYLYSIKNNEKIAWTANIINTNMPVLAIKLPILKDISKEIYKGNYESFLDIMPHKYFEDTIVCAFIIGFIKNFDMQKKYILKISKYIDNWSTVDTLKYHIKGSEKQYFEFAKKMFLSKRVFDRRIGVRILFSYKKSSEYLDKIYDLLTTLDKEEEYYVNMAASWLLCELFIHHRDKTLEFIKNNHFNKFIINKAISKCHDSYRISDSDKKVLSYLKVK